MTPDEKQIWAAVFAVETRTFPAAELRTRADGVVDAIRHADYTVLALRRVAAWRSRDGVLHEAPELREEERRDTGIQVSEGTDDIRISENTDD